MSKNKDKIHNVQMDQLYVEALVDLLVFAGNTAVVLLKNNSNLKDEELKKLKLMACDANDILQLLKQHTAIGEPTSTYLH